MSSKEIRQHLNDIGKFKFEERPTHNYFSGSKFVKELTPKDFDGINLKNKKCHFVMFYLPGCGWCKQLKDVWERLGETITFYEIAAVNSERHREFVQQFNKSTNLIPSYPTLIIFRGKPISPRYEGERSLDKMMEWCIQECK